MKTTDRPIEVYRLDADAWGPEVVTDVLRWRPDPGVPSLELDVSEVFAAL